MRFHVLLVIVAIVLCVQGMINTVSSACLPLHSPLNDLQLLMHSALVLVLNARELLLLAHLLMTAAD